jgi:hypothetical protein
MLLLTPCAPTAAVAKQRALVKMQQARQRRLLDNDSRPSSGERGSNEKMWG